MFSVPRRYIERRFVRHIGDFTEGAHVIANVRIVEHRQRGDTLRVTADLHGIIIRADSQVKLAPKGSGYAALN